MHDDVVAVDAGAGVEVHVVAVDLDARRPARSRRTASSVGRRVGARGPRPSLRCDPHRPVGSGTRSAAGRRAGPGPSPGSAVGSPIPRGRGTGSARGVAADREHLTPSSALHAETIKFGMVPSDVSRENVVQRGAVVRFLTILIASMSLLDTTSRSRLPSPVPGTSGCSDAQEETQIAGDDVPDHRGPVSGPVAGQFGPPRASRSGQAVAAWARGS